jgi:hypothetical protein
MRYTNAAYLGYQYEKRAQHADGSVHIPDQIIPGKLRRSKNSKAIRKRPKSNESFAQL